MSSIRPWLSVLCVIAGLAVGAVPAVAQEPQASLPDIEDEVMCPVCGTLLQLASESPQAERERILIREMIAEGLTKDQIKDELVAEYGPDVLAEPETDGFDLLAWLVPGVVVLIGAVAIFVGLRRWRSAGIAAETDASAGGADALSTDEQDRLDADMARYE